MTKEEHAKVLAALENSIAVGYDPFGAAKRHDEATAIMRKEPQGWMPIEEEPPHTQDILVYCDDTKEQFVAFRLPSGRYQFANAGNGLIVCCEPTHWQPLPPPPALLEKAR